MKTYLTYDNQLRAETDPAIIATLERKGWVPAPQPAYDPATQQCEWVNGDWVISASPAPTYTAEAWLDQQAYTPLRLLTCLDLEGKLRATGHTSPKLAATRSWLDALTLAAAVNPDAATSTWPPAPFAFDAVVQEAITQLQPI